MNPKERGAQATQEEDSLILGDKPWQRKEMAGLSLPAKMHICTLKSMCHEEKKRGKEKSCRPDLAEQPSRGGEAQAGQHPGL